MRYHPFRHLGLKFLSLAIAALLWLIIAGEQIVERGLRVPLEVQNLPERLILVDEPLELVDVRLRGPSSSLRRLAPGDLVAVLDVKSARPGRRLFHLTPEDVRAPFGVEVTQVNPPAIPMTFEVAGSREVPVKPAVEGDPAPGYVVGKITADPATVVVIGPQSNLSRLTEAMTEPVTIDGARSDRRESVTIGVTDPVLRLRTPERGQVSVQILPAPIERLLANVPVHLRNVGPGLSAQVLPATVSVRARGFKNVLDDLRADSVNGFVDLVGLGPGRYDLPVRVDPTRGFGVAEVEPPNVTVRVK